jgi:hypothetical protein
MPTCEELDTCRHIKLTNDHDWNPHSTDFQTEEDNLTEHLIGDYGIPSEYRRIMQVIQENPNYVVSPFFGLSTLRQLVSTNTTRRSYSTTAEKLVANWNIGLETA